MKIGENLNKTFGKVFVRNIPEAKKRLDNFKKYADCVELEYEIFESIRGDLYVPNDFELKHRNHLYLYPANQYYVGNFLSLLSVHLTVLSKRYESYIICDDDTEFYNLSMKFIKDYLPYDWDIIILGRMDSKTFDGYTNQELEPKFIIPTPTEISGSQCVAINKKCYYHILEHLLSFGEHFRIGDGMIDHLMRHKNINVYLMLPDISMQNRDDLKPYTIE